MPQEFKASMHEMRGTMLEKNNQDVQAFIDAAHILLKAKGWKYEGQRLQSALYERNYTKDDFTITIGGWHGGGKRGTSRFYGAGKSFLNLWHRKGFKNDFTIDSKLFDCDTFQEIIDRQAKAMDEALRFITKV